MVPRSEDSISLLPQGCPLHIQIRPRHTCQCWQAGAHSLLHQSRPHSLQHHCTGPSSGHTHHWHSGAQPLGMGALVGTLWRVVAKGFYCPLPIPPFPLPVQPVPGSQPSSSAQREAVCWTRCGHTLTYLACTIRAKVHTSRFPGKGCRKECLLTLFSSCHCEPAWSPSSLPVQVPQPSRHGLCQSPCSPGNSHQIPQGCSAVSGPGLSISQWVERALRAGTRLCSQLCPQDWPSSGRGKSEHLYGRFLLLHGAYLPLGWRGDAIPRGGLHWSLNFISPHPSSLQVYSTWLPNSATLMFSNIYF